MQLPLQRLPEKAAETAFHGASLARQDLALAADATAVGVERAMRRAALAASRAAGIAASVSASRQHLTLLRREERGTLGARALLPRAAAAGVRLRRESFCPDRAADFNEF